MKVYIQFRPYNWVLIRFQCISLKKFRCCPKYFISLTQRKRTKLRAIAPDTSYFKPVILKFKTLISNSSSKIIHSFCIHRVYLYTYILYTYSSPGEGEKFFTVGIFRKDTFKYAKVMVEPYICGNLNQIYRFFFSFLTKMF